MKERIFERIAEAVLDFVSGAMPMLSKVGVLSIVAVSAACFRILAQTTGFIEAYVWTPAVGVYTLALTLGIDFVSGFWLAWREKRVNVDKIADVARKGLVYMIIIALAHNFAKSQAYLFWLPEAVFSAVALSVFASVIRNLTLLGYAPAWLQDMIMTRIDRYKREAGLTAGAENETSPPPPSVL